MAARFWVGGTGTWDASNTANWASSSGGAGGQSVPVAADTVTFDAASGGGTVTVGNGYNPDVTSITMGAFTGTLDFSAFNNSPTMQTFNCSGTGTRTLNMGAGTWTLTGNNATIFSLATSTNLTFTASTATINCTYAGATGTRVLNIGNGPNLEGTTFNVNAGTDTVTCNLTTGGFFGSINFTGFTGTLGGGGGTTVDGLKGNLTLGAGMTVASDTRIYSFYGPGRTITSNGVVWKRPLGISGSGIGTSVSLVDDFVQDNTSTSTISLNNGTFDANNKNVTTYAFSSSNSNTRTLTMGSGTWTLTGNNATIWNTSTNTGMTLTANTATIDCTYSGGTGTRTINSSAASALRPNNLKVSAGTDSFTIANSSIAGLTGYLDFTGFSGTWTGTADLVVGGSITLSPTMSNTRTGALNPQATSAGTFTITTNGVNLASDMIFRGNTFAANYVLGSNLVTTGAVQMFSTSSSGSPSFSANNFNFTMASFLSSNTNTRTITMGSGTWTLTGTGTVWDTATTTGLTLNAGTSTIRINDASASSKTIESGATTLNNLDLAGVGTGTFIIGTAITTSTFNDISVTTPPHTVQVFAGKTLNVNSITWSGTSGNLNTFQSTTNGVAWNIVETNNTSQDYISLRDSAASGATFWAGANSTNVSGNTGWTFSAAPVVPAGLSGRRSKNYVGVAVM